MMEKINFILSVMLNFSVVMGNMENKNDSRCGNKCCANFYNNNGTCQHCPEGVYRVWNDDDRKCERPCPEGYYGTCAQKCVCKAFERCDKEHGCVCNADSCREINSVGLAVTLPIIFMVIIVLLVVLGIKLRISYKEFNKDNKRQVNSTLLCLEIARATFLRRDKPELHDEPEQHDEPGSQNHYCDIRESAMIKTPRASGVSFDFDNCSNDGYNHLDTSRKFQPTATVYNENTYTKFEIAGHKRKKNEETFSQYDKVLQNPQ